MARLEFRSTPPRRGQPASSRYCASGPVFRSTPPRRGQLLASRRASWTCLFRSTPPRRGQPSSNPTAPRWRRFDPRPRAGGNTAFDEWHLSPPRFRSTPPRRGQHLDADLTVRAERFRSTPPRRGQRPPLRGVGGGPVGFDPRPRAGGNRHAHRARTAAAPVSIHAPAQGATRRSRTPGRNGTVSIHAPAQGAT